MSTETPINYEYANTQAGNILMAMLTLVAIVGTISGIVWLASPAEVPLP